MRSILTVCTLAILLSCAKKEEFYFPVSEFSKTWIPSNADSLVYTDSTGVDTIYLFYNGYSTFNQPVNNNTTAQQINQSGYSGDSGFFISYALQAGIPTTDTMGRAQKTDYLRINSTNTFNEMYISNASINTSLFYLDSLVLPDSTVHFDVLTDNAFYFMNESKDILQFKSGSAWYYQR